MTADSKAAQAAGMTAADSKAAQPAGAPDAEHELALPPGMSMPIYPEPIAGFPEFGHVPLKNLMNTRDLGGMPTKDGRKIRPHRLIRSGELSSASEQDRAALVGDLGVAKVFDFRTKIEADMMPDPIPALPGVEYTHASVLSEDDIMIQALLSLKGDMGVIFKIGENAHGQVRAMYERCLLGENGRAAYARFLRTLLDTPEGAVLWHCTQGKDRCGMGSALVEYILGVPVEDICKDYLATNQFMGEWVDGMRDVMIAKFKDKFAAASAVANGAAGTAGAGAAGTAGTAGVGVAGAVAGAEGTPSMTAEEQMMSKLMEIAMKIDFSSYIFSSPDYLDGALEAVINEYGSIDAYITDGLGFSPADQEQLRAMYLE